MSGTPEDRAGGSPTTSRADTGAISPSHFAGLGLQFAVSILVFLYIGQWLDRKLGTAPWLLIVGVFLGAELSFYSMYRKLMAAQAADHTALAAPQHAASL